MEEEEAEDLSLLESLDQWMKCLTTRPSLKLKCLKETSLLRSGSVWIGFMSSPACGRGGKN